MSPIKPTFKSEDDECGSCGREFNQNSPPELVYIKDPKGKVVTLQVCLQCFREYRVAQNAEAVERNKQKPARVSKA